MLLAQRIPCDNDNIIIKILNKPYQNMKMLERDMKEHPENFNEDCEYCLIDPRPFVKLSYEKKPVISFVNDEGEQENEC